VKLGSLDGIKEGIKLFFGKAKSGFIVPLNARLKIDHLFALNFGVCAYLEAVN
jgi:hypothetical protein